MNFPRLETELKHPPEYVRKALVERELEPYFKKSGRLTQGSVARGHPVARRVRWYLAREAELL